MTLRAIILLWLLMTPIRAVIIIKTLDTLTVHDKGGNT